MLKRIANRFQQRFYLEWVLNKSSQIYNTPLIYRIDGPLDETALQAALAYFVNHHDSGCRSHFEESDGQVWQVVAERVEVALHVGQAGQEDIDAAAIERELEHRFDLSRGPLFRFTLLKSDSGSSVLVLNFHHIITDATSARHFLQLLQGCYLHFSAGSPMPPHVPAAEVPDAASDEKNRADIAYWCEQLSRRSLHVDLPRQVESPVASARGAAHFFEFDAALTAELKQFCRDHACTPFIAVAAVCGVVLARYTGKNELVLNYPVDARPAGAKGLIGCFINNFPLVLELQRHHSLLDLVDNIKLQRKQARQHAEFSLTQVVQQLREGTLADEGLFNVTVVEAYFDDAPLDMGACRWLPVQLEHKQVVGDLVFAYQPGIEQLRFRLDYRLDSFAPSFIGMLADSFTWAMKTLLAAPDTVVAGDAVLSPAMRARLERFAQGAPQAAVGQEGVMALFCRMADRHPQAPALQYRDRVLSYREVLDRAVGIAGRVRAGIDVDSADTERLVGVYCADKSLAALAIVAVLGSGCAYIPIDPQMPVGRVRELLGESGMRVLLTERALIAGLGDEDAGPTVLCLDEAPSDLPAAPDGLRLPPASALAYVIYTSGSTGRPKGVMVRHGNLGNAIADFVAALALDESDRVVGATAVGFDIFGLELFAALCSGASLLLLDEELGDAGSLCAALDRYRPTLLQGTPSFWSLLSMAAWQPREREALVALCGGEAMSHGVAAYLLRTAASVYQVYGPTETTIWSTRQVLREESQYAVIGRPIGATAVYILDEHQQLLPQGASGELYIGGSGVARGYHRRPDLTAERFLALAPCGPGADGLMYRTGDRVCWNEQGELVYQGRLDFQVKIRGHRVELGEIEYCLNQQPGVSQVAVRAFGSADQAFLAAYLVLQQGALPDQDGWRAALRERLPSYMIPRDFVVLESLPQSLNGKIDRLALPEPARSQTSASVPPASPLEHQLATIWCQVLQLDAVGVTDHFFALGGHSLLAARMLIATAKALDVQLSLSDIMRHPTIRELAAHIASATPAAAAALPAAPAQRFPLSLEQRHLYFIDQYEEGVGHSFNLSVAQRLRGALDVDALEHALQALLARHELLNVRIDDAEGQLEQHYAPQAWAPLLPQQIEREALEALLRREIAASFDLRQAPLYRIRLWQLAAQDYVLLLVLPHIIADGWSLEIMRRELGALYGALRQGRVPQLPAPTQRYSDAVAWQADWFESDAFRRSADYWRGHLAGYPGLNLPTDFPPTRERSFRGAHHEFALSEALTARLKACAAQWQVSLFSCLYCLFALQLRRYCDQDDVVICVPAANRRIGNEEVVGLFTSMLPLRLKIDDDATFGALVQAFGRDSQEALAHQGVPLESVQAPQDGRDGPSHGLLQVVFALQNANQDYAIALDGLTSEFVAVEDDVAKYDLFLSMREADGRLLGNIEYASDRFAAARIERMGGHFIALAEQLPGNDTLAVGDADIVVGSEAHWPVPPPAPAADENLVSWFRRAAHAFPTAVALQDGDQTMDYATLDAASTALAQRLRARHRRALGTELVADTLVGLCVERGMPMIVGMLAILKAGAAYVPLDPHYPSQRLRHMLEDSGVSLLLSTADCLRRSELTQALPAARCLSINADDAVDDGAEPLPEVRAEQLAYVIYTSGSTGNPKGAMLSHGNVTRLFQTSAPLFSFSERDVWCLFHSYAFDFSVWEIWGALLYGARLVIVPYHVSRDPEQFRALLLRQRVTVLNQTPTAFAQLTSEDVRHPDYLPLRYVVFGGEALQVSTLAPWYRKYAGTTRLVNMYGITETTVHVSFKALSPEDLDRPYCNDIGRPLPDLTALVLDSRRRLCPVGVSGELYIGGPGLARGYLRQPALTERAFIRDARLLGGERLYKTGDLARWLPDGHLEYLGRNDQQVKVRGFRIELGELQATLMRLPQVSQALALHEPERDAIVLYYVAEHALDPDELYRHLKQSLPDFMLPQRLVHTPVLPLTSNGKVDRTALAALTADMPDAPQRAAAPATAMEKLLLEVWERVLQQPVHSVHADFFTVGGDSLRLLDVIRAVRQAGYAFAPRDMFSHPTIAQLARVVRPAGWNPERHAVAPFSLLTEEQLRACRTPDDEDIYPLTALQEGMLFHSELTAHASTYLDIISCRVDGPFRHAAFQQVLQQLMQHHPVLRTVFVRNEAGLWQAVRQGLPLPLAVTDLSGLSPSDQEAALEQFFTTERGRRFTPDSGPLWRLAIHTLGAGFHLTLTCHHAILDGWSVAVFLTQLLQRYDGALDGNTVPLLPRRLAFRDYVGEEIALRRDPAQRRYWQEVWQQREATLIAPAPADTAAGLSGSLARHVVPLSPALRLALRELQQEQGVGLDSVLLAAHVQALSRYTGRRSVATGLATNGRLADDDNGMLGLFLNSTPCCVTLEPQQSPLAFLRQLVNHKASLQPYRSFPLLDIQQDARRGVLFDTLFNFVNFHVFDQLRGMGHLQVRPGYCYEETNFALVCQTGIDPDDGELKVELIFDTARLSEARIAAFSLFYRDALHDLTDRRAAASAQADSAALQALLPPRQWLGGRGTDLGRAGIAERIVALAARHPERVALRANGASLSYRMLDGWSNAIARQMLDQGGGVSLAGQRVGLFSSRQMSTIAAMLAILKLGAAYVPLDATHPRAHLEQLARDAELACIAGCADSLAQHDWIAPAQTCVLASEPGWGEPLTGVAPATDDALAYVMYTSGTSGKPKGVMIGQAAIVRLVQDTDYVAIEARHVVAQAASLSFDAATFEVWGALLNGATLALAPADSLLDNQRFAAFLREERVDILWLTARLFDGYVSTGHAAMFRDLSYLLVGGDVLNPATIGAVLRCPQGRPRHLLNGYGPTENTTFTCVHEIREASLPDIPIGNPIARTQVYVLDELMRQVPVGFTGELYTAGTGLARGYLHGGERNAAFVELDLVDADSAEPLRRRLYRTGDAVRWLPSGELAFLGRIDRMVKVNGYRVDPGEVEAAALACPGVAQCIVVARGEPERQLALYFSSGAAQPSADALRAALRQRLPHFMVPAHVIGLASLPINRNGKIDATRLPAPATVDSAIPVPAMAGATQGRLHTIWTDLLQVPALGAQDSFFEKGGDSLLAMQLRHQINLSFDADIAVVDVFRYPTIEAMARHLDDAPSAAAPAGADAAQRAGQFKAQRTRFKPLSNTQ